MHFQVALNQSPLEPKDVFYRKQKLTEIFHIYVTCFILRFLLRTFCKTVGEPLYLLTVHPKLIFRGALKKALMVLEDRFYQRQYFAKIFPSPLTLTLQIHLHPSKVPPLVHHKVYPKLISNEPITNIILCYFSLN